MDGPCDGRSKRTYIRTTIANNPHDPLGCIVSCEQCYEKHPVPFPESAIKKIPMKITRFRRNLNNGEFVVFLQGSYTRIQLPKVYLDIIIIFKNGKLYSISFWFSENGYIYDENSKNLDWRTWTGYSDQICLPCYAKLFWCLGCFFVTNWTRKDLSYWYNKLYKNSIYRLLSAILESIWWKKSLNLNYIIKSKT